MAPVSRRIAAGLLLCATLAGCADITGKWDSAGLEPQMASDQFVFLRPKGFQGDFIRASLDLREDKTYTAEVYYASDMSFSNGGWSLIANRLRLVDNKYGTFTYPVELDRDGRDMAILQPIKGTDVRLHMRRQRPLLPLPDWPRSGERKPGTERKYPTGVHR